MSHSCDVAHLATSFAALFAATCFDGFLVERGVTFVMARRVTDCTYYLTSGCHKVR